MDGFLSENKMKDLLLAGFDINKFYRIVIMKNIFL